MTNQEFFEDRRQRQAAARQQYKKGTGELRSVKNLTAAIRLNLICQEERRQPTPAEIELCQDLQIVPRAGAAQ